MEKRENDCWASRMFAGKSPQSYRSFDRFNLACGFRKPQVTEQLYPTVMAAKS